MTNQAIFTVLLIAAWVLVSLGWAMRAKSWLSLSLGLAVLAAVALILAGTVRL
jgi:hypothetical protein